MNQKIYFNEDFTLEEIQEFKDITLRLYNRKLSTEEAKDQLSRKIAAYELLHYFDLKLPIENAQDRVHNEH